MSDNNQNYYTRWEDLPGEFRYKSTHFVDLSNNVVGLVADFKQQCSKRGYRVSGGVVESFINRTLDIWGWALAPNPGHPGSFWMMEDNSRELDSSGL